MLRARREFELNVCLATSFEAEFVFLRTQDFFPCSQKTVFPSRCLKSIGARRNVCSAYRWRASGEPVNSMGNGNVGATRLTDCVSVYLLAPDSWWRTGMHHRRKAIRAMPANKPVPSNTRHDGSGTVVPTTTGSSPKTVPLGLLFASPL